MVSHEKPGTITIDEIRDQVIHDVDIRPYYSPYKIYIIADAAYDDVPRLRMLFSRRLRSHRNMQ